MNRIYKIVKNNSTGCMTAVSELAKGAKKGKTKLIALTLLGGISLSVNAASLPTGFVPGSNDNQVGATIINSDETIDLAASGLNSAISNSGEEVKKYTLTSDSVLNSYQKDKNQDDYIGSISVTGEINDLKNDSINKTTTNYQDPATSSSFSIQTIPGVTSNNVVLTDSTVSVNFYEKEPNQYSNMQLVEVSNSANLTIEDTGLNVNDNVLNVVAKNESGMITVKEGSSLTIGTNISYYTGGSLSESTAYNESLTHTKTINTGDINKVTYSGTITSVLGSRDISNADDLIRYSNDLISYITQNRDNVCTDYPSSEDMPAFYDNQMNLAYSTSTTSGSITLTLNNNDMTDLAEKDNGLLTAFNNKLTTNNLPDIGTVSTQKNKFITLEGNDTSVTINSGATLSNKADGKISEGTVIYAGDDGTGKVINVDGTTNANGKTAIYGQNTEVNIAADTGQIVGNILGTTHNTINNKGVLTGYIKTGDNLEVNNEGTITSYVFGGTNSRIVNDGTIKNYIRLGSNSQITNNINSIIENYISSNGDDIVVNNYGLIKNFVSIQGSNGKINNDGDALMVIPPKNNRIQK